MLPGRGLVRPENELPELVVRVLEAAVEGLEPAVLAFLECRVLDPCLLLLALVPSLEKIDDPGDIERVAKWPEKASQVIEHLVVATGDVKVSDLDDMKGGVILFSQDEGVIIRATVSTRCAITITCKTGLHQVEHEERVLSEPIAARHGRGLIEIEGGGGVEQGAILAEKLVPEQVTLSILPVLVQARQGSRPEHQARRGLHRAEMNGDGDTSPEPVGFGVDPVQRHRDEISGKALANLIGLHVPGAHDVHDKAVCILGTWFLAFWIEERGDAEVWRDDGRL